MLVNTDIIPHIIHDKMYVSVLYLYDIKLYFKYWAIESVYQVVYTRTHGYLKVIDTLLSMKYKLVRK